MLTLKDITETVRDYLEGRLTLPEFTVVTNKLYYNQRDINPDAYPYLAGVFTRIGELKRLSWSEETLKSHLTRHRLSYLADP